jgi:hypothetical protein
MELQLDKSKPANVGENKSISVEHSFNYDKNIATLKVSFHNKKLFEKAIEALSNK